MPDGFLSPFWRDALAVFGLGISVAGLLGGWLRRRRGLTAEGQFFFPLLRGTSRYPDKGIGSLGCLGGPALIALIASALWLPVPEPTEGIGVQIYALLALVGVASAGLIEILVLKVFAAHFPALYRPENEWIVQPICTAVATCIAIAALVGAALGYGSPVWWRRCIGLVSSAFLLGYLFYLISDVIGPPIERWARSLRDFVRGTTEKGPPRATT